mmetsp:Transcript_92949/g.262474  ORF Transcript_92949/g.262474 Transcript_92949/m.262474 type:complete len:290 (+) Transcript_92949:253-1122(+)
MLNSVDLWVDLVRAFGVSMSFSSQGPSGAGLCSSDGPASGCKGSLEGAVLCRDGSRAIRPSGERAGSGTAESGECRFALLPQGATWGEPPCSPRGGPVREHRPKDACSRGKARRSECAGAQTTARGTATGRERAPESVHTAGFTAETLSTASSRSSWGGSSARSCSLVESRGASSASSGASLCGFSAASCSLADSRGASSRASSCGFSAASCSRVDTGGASSSSGEHSGSRSALAAGTVARAPLQVLSDVRCFSESFFSNCPETRFWASPCIGSARSKSSWTPWVRCSS